MQVQAVGTSFPIAKQSRGSVVTHVTQAVQCSKTLSSKKSTRKYGSEESNNSSVSKPRQSWVKTLGCTPPQSVKFLQLPNSRHSNSSWSRQEPSLAAGKKGLVLTKEKDTEEFLKDTRTTPDDYTVPGGAPREPTAPEKVPDVNKSPPAKTGFGVTKKKDDNTTQAGLGQSPEKKKEMDQSRDEDLSDSRTTPDDYTIPGGAPREPTAPEKVPDVNKSPPAKTGFGVTKKTDETTTQAALGQSPEKKKEMDQSRDEDLSDSRTTPDDYTVPGGAPREPTAPEKVPDVNKSPPAKTGFGVTKKTDETTTQAALGQSPEKKEQMDQSKDEDLSDSRTTPDDYTIPGGAPREPTAPEKVPDVNKSPPAKTGFGVTKKTDETTTQASSTIQVGEGEYPKGGDYLAPAPAPPPPEGTGVHPPDCGGAEEACEGGTTELERKLDEARKNSEQGQTSGRSEERQAVPA